MEGNPSGTLEQQVAYLLTQVSSLAQANQELTTALDAQTQKLLLLEASVQGEVANLTTNQDSLQTILSTHSQSLSNETTARGVVDNGLTTEVIDLKDQHLNDHTYLIGLIEEHHGDWMAATASQTGAMDAETQARIAGDEANTTAISVVESTVTARVDAIESRVNVYEDVLDLTTMDSIDLTMDSMDYRFDWSMLSGSQEWRIELAEALHITQTELDEHIRQIEAKINTASVAASQALQNTEMQSLINTIAGAVSLNILDPVLAKQIEDATVGIAQERQERVAALIAEANSRVSQLSSLASTVDQEIQDRIDADAAEALIREEMINQISVNLNDLVNAAVTEQITAGVFDDTALAQRVSALEASLTANTAGSEELAGNDVSVSYENVVTALVDSDTAIYRNLEEAKTSFTNGLTTTEGKITDLTLSVSNLDSNVTQRMEALESQFTNELNTSIANLENNYYTITAADQAISAATTNLSTTLTQNYESAILDALDTVTVSTSSTQEIIDQRLTDHPVSWYRTNYPQKRVIELKDAVTVGLTVAMVGQTTGTLTTSVPWGDVSGGAVKQVMEGSDDLHRWVRYSTGLEGAESWTPWVNTTQSFTTSLEETSTTIDGIKAVKTVTVDNNGVLSGYGLISELTEGVVTSAFGINANQFYVGSPVDGRKMFVVTTTPTVIGGTSYPAGTWFDTANIATASIGKAHIQDAAIDSAKIANAAIDSAKIADAVITNAKLANASITAAKIVDGEITNAKIGNAQISTGKIANLAVDTLRIADRAVTAPILVSKAAGTIIRPGYGWAPNEYPVQEFINMSVTGLAPNTYVLITLLGKIAVTFGPDGGSLSRVDRGTFYLKLGDTFLYNFNKVADGWETVYYDQIVGNDTRGSAFVTLVKSDAWGNIILTGAFGAFTFDRYIEVKISWSTLQMHLVELKK